MGAIERRRVQLLTADATRLSCLLFLKRSSHIRILCSTSNKSDVWMNEATPNRWTHCRQNIQRDQFRGQHLNTHTYTPLLSLLVQQSDLVLILSREVLVQLTARGVPFQTEL